MLTQAARTFAISGFTRARAFGSSCVDRLKLNRDGSVGIVFAAMIIPVTATIGMAVDLGHAIKVKTALQVTLDAAALAAGREYQTTSDADAALARAREHFAAALPHDVTAEIINTRLDEEGSTVEIAAKATVDTTFLAILGTDQMEITLSSTAGTGIGMSSKDLEVAMMLDITGSMSGHKIADLKTAAKDLIQSLLPNEDAAEHARISVVPFSEAVRPGSDVLASVIGSQPATKSLRNSSGRRHTYTLTNCVSERLGADAFTDALPASGSYVGPVYTEDGSCMPSSTVEPLTNDKATLDAKVDGLAANGWTAGQIGTAWAWYTISPDWAGIWPAESRPAAFSDDVTKVAVLMTDGEYNTDYRQGVQTRTIGGAPSNGSSDSQARQMCAAMKAEGILVYTVGFQLTDSNAIETLSECASGGSYAFLADNGSELRQAFRDIAFRLSDLRLTR